MDRLNPDKLHVTYLNGVGLEKAIIPRRYTLTHSDTSGELFLSIGNNFNLKQISKLYTRFMRDEVLGELVDCGEKFIIKIYCHVSGGIILGTARWRYSIFQSELPLVLEGIRYGDRDLFEQKPELDNATVQIHFQFNNERSNKIEIWPSISNYR
jgi:hypothetical protein